jgi:aspartyl-tRNA(Asn)/glutamyl-tRNA(Gln) amidotransferase subunit C
MASHLTRDEVAHIADLARLDLSPSELDLFAPQLADILAYAATVQQADTTGIENLETSDPLSPGISLLRDDVSAPGIARDAAIAEAPDGVRESGLFRVPKVF